MTTVASTRQRDLLLARVIARSIPAHARRQLIAALFIEIDHIGQRQWANWFAGVVEDYEV